MPDQPGQENQPKIHIDEDWKTQAQAEKEALARKLETEKGRQQTRRGPMPPASFAFLVSTLSTQALVALGHVENPLTGRADRDLDQAKHFIDTLQMLEGKTKGNLTPEESRLLQSAIHELRLAYVEALSPPSPSRES